MEGGPAVIYRAMQRLLPQHVGAATFGTRRWRGLEPRPRCTPSSTRLADELERLARDLATASTEGERIRAGAAAVAVAARRSVSTPRRPRNRLGAAPVTDPRWIIHLPTRLHRRRRGLRRWRWRYVSLARARARHRLRRDDAVSEEDRQFLHTRVWCDRRPPRRRPLRPADRPPRRVVCGRALAAVKTCSDESPRAAVVSVPSPADPASRSCVGPVPPRWISATARRAQVLTLIRRTSSTTWSARVHDLIKTDDPVEAELFAANFLSAGDLAGEDFTEALNEGMLPAVAEIGTPEALAVLLAIDAVREGTVAAAAARRRMDAGVTAPSWASELRQPVRVGPCRRFADPAGSASMLVCAFERAGRSYGFLLHVDHLDCDAAADIVFFPAHDLDEVVSTIQQNGRRAGLTIAEELLDPAEFRWQVARALDARADHDQERDPGAVGRRIRRRGRSGLPPAGGAAASPNPCAARADAPTGRARRRRGLRPPSICWT